MKKKQIITRAEREILENIAQAGSKLLR